MKVKKILAIFISIILLSIVFIGGNFWYNKKIIDKSITANTGEYVVLVHGLGRTSFSMQKIGRELVKQNYSVININYPSRSDTIENLVDDYLKKDLTEKYLNKDEKINFVTHSMGGIMVRYFLLNNELANVNRIVMLAPPNSGSASADKWSLNRFVNNIMGPALRELMTGENSFVNNLGEFDFEVGVIAGEYDGKVFASQTKLNKMKDFVILPCWHTFIMSDLEVIKKTINFLQTGIL